MSSTFRAPIKVIADILQHELDLADGHIMTTGQKWNIPNSAGLYVALSYMGSSKVICTSSKFDPNTNSETQTATTLSGIQIDVMSFDNSSRDRKEEIAMALGSIYAQQVQERYQCQVARLPGPFLDTSFIEGSGILKRFTSNISVTALFSKEKVVEYFDQFSKPETTFNK